MAVINATLYRVEVAPVDVGRVNPVYQDQENLIFHGVQVTVNKIKFINIEKFNLLWPFI